MNVGVDMAFLMVAHPSIHPSLWVIVGVLSHPISYQWWPFYVL